MNKIIVYTLGLIGSVGAAVMPADFSYAQGKAANPPVTVGSAQPPPIKFGDGRTLTYKVSKEPITRSDLRGPANVGTISYFPDGGFKAEGNLGGFQFFYEHRHGLDGDVEIDSLVVSRLNHTWKFFDYPSKGLPDFAEIGGVKVQLGSPGFYEAQGPKKPWKDLTFEEALRIRFSEWKSKLNVPEIKTQAEKLKISKKKMRESLDALVE